MHLLRAGTALFAVGIVASAATEAGAAAGIPLLLSALVLLAAGGVRSLLRPRPRAA